MRQYVAKHMAMQVLSDGVSLVGLTKSKAELRLDLMQAVGAASEVSKNDHIRTSAWKHLVLEGAALDAILATADQLHAFNHDVFVAVRGDEDDSVAKNKNS
eukprot:661426-Amphidinium_carterae.2